MRPVKHYVLKLNKSEWLADYEVYNNTITPCFTHIPEHAMRMTHSRAIVVQEAIARRCISVDVVDEMCIGYMGE